MKVFAHIALFLFCIGLVFAQVEVVKVQKAPKNTMFTVEGGEELIITPSQNVEKTYVFIDGKPSTVFGSLEAKKSKTIPIKLQGEHEIEIRTVVKQNYEWQDFVVTKNDYPYGLVYVEYTEENDRVEFAVKGADAILPADVNQAGKRNVKDEFTSYTLSANGEEGHTCYSLLTTGKTVAFNCYIQDYPTTLDISLEIGLTETHNATFNYSKPAKEQKEELDESIVLPPSQNDPETQQLQKQISTQEIKTHNNIVLQDSVPQQPNALPQVFIWFIALLFAVVIFLLFIASYQKIDLK